MFIIAIYRVYTCISDGKIKTQGLGPVWVTNLTDDAIADRIGAAYMHYVAPFIETPVPPYMNIVFHLFCLLPLLSLDFTILLTDHTSYNMQSNSTLIQSVRYTCTMIASTTLSAPIGFIRCHIVHDSRGNVSMVIDYTHQGRQTRQNSGGLQI